MLNLFQHLQKIPEPNSGQALKQVQDDNYVGIILTNLCLPSFIVMVLSTVTVALISFIFFPSISTAPSDMSLLISDLLLKIPKEFIRSIIVYSPVTTAALGISSGVFFF